MVLFKPRIKTGGLDPYISRQADGTRKKASREN